MVNARGRFPALALGALVLLATACAQGGEEEAPAPHRRSGAGRG